MRLGCWLSVLQKMVFVGILFQCACNVTVVSPCVAGLPRIGGGDPCPPKRVLTWGYDGGHAGMTDGTDTNPGGTNAASKAHINQWLTFAEGSHKAKADCLPSGPCIPVLYVDPGIIYIPSEKPPSPSPQAACPALPDTDFYADSGFTEDWLLHTSAPYSPDKRKSSYVYDLYFCNKTMGGVMLYPNEGNQAVQSWYKNNVLNRWPGFWMMHDDLSLSSHTWASAELPNASTGLEAIASFIDAMQVPVVANSLGAYKNGPLGKDTEYEGIYSDPTALIAKNSKHNIWGLISEGQLELGINPPNAMQFYRELNTQSILFSGANPIAYVLLNSTDPTPNRRFHTGLFWLGFRDGYSVNWANFQGKDGKVLAVYPEETLYPTAPRQTMRRISIGMNDVVAENASGCKLNGGLDNSASSFDDSFSGGARDLVVACGTFTYGRNDYPSGVYRREFAQCYNSGVAFGPCAVIVNDTDQSRVIESSWLTTTYRNQISWSATNVLDAGCAESGCPTTALNVAGAPFVAGDTSVPPRDAVFLSR